MKTLITILIFTLALAACADAQVGPEPQGPPASTVGQIDPTVNPTSTAVPAQPARPIRTPTPEPPPTAEPTETPMPTPTPQPTWTPVPTPTWTPTPTATPTVLPTPTWTPTPTATPCAVDDSTSEERRALYISLNPGWSSASDSVRSFLKSQFDPLEAQYLAFRTLYPGQVGTWRGYLMSNPAVPCDLKINGYRTRVVTSKLRLPAVFPV